MRRDRLYDWGTVAFVLELIARIFQHSSEAHAPNRPSPVESPKPVLVKVVNPEEEKTNTVTTTTVSQPANVQKQPQNRGHQGR